MKTLHTFRHKSGEVFTVELEVNSNEIAKALAVRAYASKHGKAQSLNGDIKCRIIERVKP